MTAGTTVLFDPNFTPADLKAGKAPHPVIAGQIIRDNIFYKRLKYLVEVIDERGPSGKRIFHNTDTYGSTVVLIPEAIQIVTT